MLFFGLPPLARSALLALAVVVLVITVFTPDADPAPRGPLGVVVTNTGTQVTVRTSDGQLHTVGTDPNRVTQCASGRTFPACAH